MRAEAKVIRMDEHRSSGPQLEDGHVRIANELYDAILAKISSFRHLKVALAIIRKTYGFSKKEDDITISQLSDITGIHRNNVGTALRELEEMRVINPVRAGRHGLIVGLNKHHEEWASDEVKARGPGRKAINLIAQKEGNQNVASEQSNRLPATINLIEISNQNVAHNNQPQQPTPTTNPNMARSEDRAAFDAFWDAFGKKDGKAQAQKAFDALLASADDREATLAAVMRGAEKEAKRRPFLLAKGATPMYAQGWLSQRRFEDESLLAWGEFTPEQQAFIDTYNANIGDVSPRVTEWTEERAALIDVARLGHWRMEQWADFWRFVRDECEFHWPVSIEWMLDRKNFGKVRGRQYLRSEVAQ